MARNSTYVFAGCAPPETPDGMPLVEGEEGILTAARQFVADQHTAPDGNVLLASRGTTFYRYERWYRCEGWPILPLERLTRDSWDWLARCWRRGRSGFRHVAPTQRMLRAFMLQLRYSVPMLHESLAGKFFHDMPIEPPIVA